VLSRVIDYAFVGQYDFKDLTVQFGWRMKKGHPVQMADCTGHRGFLLLFRWPLVCYHEGGNDPAFIY